MAQRKNNEEQEREAQARAREEQQAAEETKGGKQHNGQAHANQFTQGRNDDRGRKE